MRTFFKSSKYAVLGILLLIFGLPVTAQDQNKATLSHPSAEKDLEIAKATVEAYEDGDWEGLRSYLAEDATIYGLGNYDSLSVEGTINYWTDGREDGQPSLEDDGVWLTVSVPEGPRAGNWVYHWGTNTITYKDGEQVTFPFHVALKMDNNKISETHFYYDNMKIIRAMGYVINPPLEEKEDKFLESEQY